MKLTAFDINRDQVEASHPQMREHAAQRRAFHLRVRARRVRDGGGRIGEVLGEPALRRQAPWLMPLSCDDTRRFKKQRLLGG